MEHIGERIRIRRKMLNMSQADLAEKVGYDTDNNKSTISKIETGVNDITRTKITIFAKALDTTEAFLMGWTDNPELTHEEVISNELQNNTNTSKIAYIPTPKEQELKDLIDKSGLPDEKLDVLIGMIKSWK